MPYDLERLIQEHDALTHFADRLAAAIDATPRDMALIVNLRSELTVLLAEHLAKEDSFLYVESLRANEADFRAALDAFERDFAALSGDWVAYMERWPVDSVPADVEEFCSATSELLARLKARITHENRLMYPLALERGRIRLRARS